MPDTVFGVPLHPLVNHAAVVLVPLAVLGTLLITVVPRWRTVYGWLVVALAAVAFATVPVATRSGATSRRRWSSAGRLSTRCLSTRRWVTA